MSTSEPPYAHQFPVHAYGLVTGSFEASRSGVAGVTIRRSVVCGYGRCTRACSGFMITARDVVSSLGICRTGWAGAYSGGRIAWGGRAPPTYPLFREDRSPSGTGASVIPQMRHPRRRGVNPGAEHPGIHRKRRAHMAALLIGASRWTLAVAAPLATGNERASGRIPLCPGESKPAITPRHGGNDRWTNSAGVSCPFPLPARERRGSFGTLRAVGDGPGKVGEFAVVGASVRAEDAERRTPQ